MQLNELDRKIINHWQGDVPVTSRPYAVIAQDLGVDEEMVITRLQTLLDSGVLTRFGPMYNIEKLGGSFCLAAMSVPEKQFDEIAAKVNAHPEIAHNYQRVHKLNMWFVIATETPEQINDVANEIENETGLPVLCFPKQHEFFVEMKLKV